MTASDSGRTPDIRPDRRTLEVVQQHVQDQRNAGATPLPPHGASQGFRGRFRMNPDDLRAVLAAVASGTLDIDAAVHRLGSQADRTSPTADTARQPRPAGAAGAAGAAGDGEGWVDLGFARVDTDRGLRTGDPEVVYAAGKSPRQIVAIVATLRAAEADRPTLVTRADAATVEALRAAWPDLHTTLPGVPGAPEAPAPDPAVARTQTVVVGDWPVSRGRVVVVAAGTSDAPVAHEAAVTARASGAGVEVLTDVGVAGIHRLLAHRATLATADCLVVVAGMEGALPSVVGGLVGTPAVAVPTSVGYGASFGGLAALLAMLNSCAPGVAVCNIDNGFGAGLFAARVARRGPGGRCGGSQDMSS